MRKIKINVEKDSQLLQFEVAEYLHHEGDRCKFDVFSGDQFVASFVPDQHEYLKICKNPGVIEDELLYLIADKIEALQL